jgi:hypothetical protein
MRMLALTSKIAPYLLATAAIAGCGSNNDSTPDTSIADARPIVADAAVVPPQIDSAPVDDGGVGIEVAQTQEAGGPAVNYCTTKPPVKAVSNIAGTWVVRAVATQEVRVLGTVLYPETVFYMLTTITQSGTALSLFGRYCDRSEVDKDSMVTVIIPDNWAHTEKVVNRAGTLVVGADGVPVLNFPSVVELAGAVADATNDQLPTSPTDPRVIDEDNDGFPGITVSVTGLARGDLYSAQRQTTAIQAIPVAADRFEGNLTFLSEQQVLASNPTSLQTLYATAKTITDPEVCSSTFAMVKVADATLDAGGAPVDCAWVRTNEAKLFP